MSKTEKTIEFKMDSETLLGLNPKDALTPETFKLLADEFLVQVDAATKAANANFKMTGNPEAKRKAKRMEAKAETAKFLRALAYNDTNTLLTMNSERAKALNETTNSEGGFLVPEDFENTILKFEEKYDFLASEMSQHEMKSDVKRLNALSGEPTTYIVGELAEIDSSQPSFAEPVLTVKKYGTIVAWSNELAEDNELNGLDSLVAERMARSQAKKFEDEIINGVTAGSEGLFNAPGVSLVTMSPGRTNFNQATIDDLFEMQNALGEIDEELLKEAKFHMSRSVYSIFRLSKASGSGEYHLPIGGRNAEIDGNPIVLNNRFPKKTDTAISKKFILLADLKKHGHVGNRGGIRVELFNSGTIKAGGSSVNLITQDAKALRMVRRRAFTTALPTGMVFLRTAAA